MKQVQSNWPWQAPTNRLTPVRLLRKSGEVYTRWCANAKGVNYLYNLADQELKNRRQKLLVAPNLGPENAGFSATIFF